MKLGLQMPWKRASWFCFCVASKSPVWRSFPADAFLINTNADNLTGSIDEPVEDGDTALHLACLYGHFHCVQVSWLILRNFLKSMSVKMITIIVSSACFFPHSYFWKEELTWKLKMKTVQFLFMMLVQEVG